MPQDTLLDPDQVEEMYLILSAEMPGRGNSAKGPKGQPDPFRTCISCILSAQSLDKNTAAATQMLFGLAESPGAMTELSKEEIARAIKPCGLYNVKAKRILKFCEALLDEFAGEVPSTREQLMSLPGIGRKCADIVLQFAFDIDTIAVDTHVHRVCNRTGLTNQKTAAATADQLEKRTPDWARHEAHFWLIQFGKRVCKSRKPKCLKCPLQQICCYYAREKLSTA